MEFNEILDQVRSKVSDEDKGLIDGLLRKVENQFKYTNEEIASLKRENGDRRVKVRELEGNLAEKDAEIEKLSNDTTVTELTQKVEALQGFQNQVYTQNRENFKSRIGEIEKQASFEKVSQTLAIPKKDEKFDFESMSDEQVQSGLNKLTEYETLGLFQQKNNQGSKTVPIVDSDLDDNDVDIEKLAVTDPEAANKWLAKRGLGI